MNNSGFERSLSIFLIVAGALVFCAPARADNCVSLPATLVSWWAGQGNALDAKDHNDGTLAGNTIFVPGRVGSAFDFDGSGDAVIVGSATNLQLQNFSIEAWIKRSDPDFATFGTHTTALFFSYGSLGYGFGIWDDGRLFLTRVDIDNVTSTVSITDTNFHHVAVTKSGTVVIFYIDGVAYPPVPYGNTFTFSSPAAIGARSDTMDDSFFGTIDELAVYSGVLAASDILSIYSAGSAGKCRNPIGPQIVAQPVDQMVYVGDTANIGVGVNGDSPLNYQWRFNGAELPGQTNQSLTLPNIQTNNAGLYSVVVTNLAGSATSSNALVTVNPRPPCVPIPPGIVSWWRAETNAFDAAGNNTGTLLGNTSYTPGRVGSAFRFDGAGDAVSVGNPANLQLQNFTIEAWIKRSNPSIATFGSHTSALFFGYGSGGYGFGMFDDGRLFLTRVDIDNVALQSGITDTNVFHHVAVTKSNSTVVFYIDGQAYPAPSYLTTFSFATAAALGARGDTIDDSFLGAVDELAVYNRALNPEEILAIYNADGSGKCKVPIPPAIITQPTNKTVYVGDTVTFNVSASGDQPLYYQWRLGGTNLVGRTTSVLTLSNVQFTNAGTYDVLVSNSVDSVLSSNAMLTVNPRPPCVPPPAGLVSWWRAELNQTDAWDSNNGQMSIGVYVNGKVGSAFSFVNGFVQVPDSTSLRITNAITIEAWVNPSTLAGTLPRTILTKFEYPLSQPPLNQSSYFLGLTNNGSVLFMLSGSGSARTNTALVTSKLIPVNQWSFVVATYDGAVMSIYINGALAAQTNYSGKIFPGNSNLSIGSIPGSSGFAGGAWPFAGQLDELSLYNRALGADEIQAVYAADISGKCLAPPVITSQPQSQAVPLGEDALFSVSVLGSRPLKYQWRFNNTILLNATNATLLLERVQSNRAGIYSVAVTNALGFALSSNATLTLLPAPVCVPPPPGLISWWPADGTALDVIGTNHATLTGVIVGPSLFYTTGKVSLAFNLSNNLAIERSVPVISVTNSQSLNFGSNADFSLEAWIKVAPGFTVSPYMTIVDKRTVAPLNGIGYSLLLNQGRLACWLGTAPASLTNATMYLSSGPDLRDGMFHHVALSLNRGATNGGNLFVDGQVVLTFDPTARRGDLSNSASLVIGSPIPIPIFVGNSNSFFNGLIDEVALYNRALSPSEILGIRMAGAAGKCKDRPVILTQPGSQRVTVGSNATFTVSAAGATPLRYQWFRGSLAQSGATNASYSFTVQSSSAGLYSVRVSNVFGTVTSSNAVLTINNPPLAQSQQISLNEDTVAPITLHGIDIDGNALTYSVVSPPAHGSLLGVPPNLSYSPVTNYNGQDSFTFKANDGQVDSVPATVRITVLPVNDAPYAVPTVSPLFALTPAETNLLIFSANNSNALAVLDGSASSDVENDPLTFLWIDGTNTIGAGVRVTNVFAVGSHDITLQVSDGRDIGSGALTFEVITPAESIYLLINLLEDTGNISRPLEAVLKAAAESAFAGNFTATGNQLRAFQNKVAAQIGRNDPALADELIAAAQEIIDRLP